MVDIKEDHTKNNSMKNKILIVSFFLTFQLFAQSVFDKAYNEFLNYNNKKADSLLNISIELKENVAKCYQYKAIINIDEFKLEEAKLNIDIFFALDPKDAQVYSLYGQYYLYKKEYKKALEYYNKSIKMDSSNSDAFGDRGMVKCFLDDLDGSMQDFNTAISMDPNNENHYSNRGYTEIIMNKLEDALKDFDKSLSLSPNQKAYANKAIVLIIKEDYIGAIHNLNNSLGFFEMDPIVLYQRGLCYERINALEKACNDYKLSNSIYKNDQASEGILRLKCK
ncbi:tetratricopeptide repeat protein [Flavobacterium jumunjinense]